MMKQLLTFMFLALGTLVFTGCGDDDTMTDPCEGVTCPDGFICNNGTCEVNSEFLKTGQITADETWTTGNTYTLLDRVTVVDGVCLTIEPGVVIKGAAGTGANASALLVARGAQIKANGTAASPIIFTTIADNIEPGEIVSPNMDASQAGFWGGLIVLGNAPISVSAEDQVGNGEAQIEGIPATDVNGRYGGSDAEDNSGTITYVSIRHGGSNIGEGNEINGLTLGGVGSGTTINHVEVVANADDGIEWFGGTVDVTNALVWACQDDGMDTDQAWNGVCDNFIVAVPDGGSCFELDGPEGDFEQGPAEFKNGTVYVGKDADHIIDWDGSTNCGVNNVYILGIDGGDGMDDDGYDPAEGFESYGGDGTGTTGNFDINVPGGYDITTLLGANSGDFMVVSIGNNTRGANNVFGWTFGGASGTLSSLGL